MRRAVFSTFLFTAILGLGCLGVAVPGRTEGLKHPIGLGKDCKALFEEYRGRAEHSSGEMGFYYSAFAYAYGASGSYACGFSLDPRGAVERCNTMSSFDSGVLTLSGNAAGPILATT